jgi:hypothetical protein
VSGSAGGCFFVCCVFLVRVQPSFCVVCFAGVGARLCLGSPSRHL